LKPIPYPIFYTLLFTVICIIFGLLIHYLVERPILAWLRSRLQVKRSARLAPSEKGASEASLMDPGAERELILGAEKPL
jgi:peptidoglycan/LPS O-acetylase OafA/YrhL